MRDVGSILHELEEIGALRTVPDPDPEPEVVPVAAVAPVVQAARKVLEKAEPVRTPLPTLHGILSQIDALRAEVLRLMEAVGAPLPETPALALSAPAQEKPKKKRRQAAPSPAPKVEVAPQSSPNPLEEARARIRARIRGEDIEARRVAYEEEEEAVPFVGSDRAVPDRDGVQHVMTVGGTGL